MREKSKSRILGIDPGTRHVGWGVIEASGQTLSYVASGVVSVEKIEPYPARLAAIYRRLACVIADYAPDVIGIEEAFYSKNAQSAFRIGEGRAVAILAGANAGLEVFEYPARLIKKSVTSAGGADKQQVKSMVEKILAIGKFEGRLDETDALAIAICHHHRRRRF